MIVMNGQSFESYQMAYKTGLFSCEELGGIKEWDDEAMEYHIIFPDGSCCWDFGGAK